MPTRWLTTIARRNGAQPAASTYRSIVAASGQSLEQRAGGRVRRQSLEERPRVDLESPRNLVVRRVAAGGLLVPGHIHLRRSHPAETRQDADEPLGQVRLAELRHVFAELSAAFLRPDPQVLVEVEWPEALDDRTTGHLHHGSQSFAPDRDQGVAEVERDRPDPRGIQRPRRRHVATLEGQISRYGQ